MGWNNEVPQLLLPPDLEDPNTDLQTTGNPDLDDALAYLFQQIQFNTKQAHDNVSELADVLRTLGASFERYGANVNRILNGQIEFPTPYATEHTGNLKISYVQVVTYGTGNGVALQIPHGYGDGTQGQIPRGWFQMASSASSSATASGRFLDQLLGSASASPIVAGYTGADATSATTITGRPGATANGWVGNDIRAGDQIKLSKNIAGAGTIASSAGSTTITGTGSAFTTAAKVGWLIRMTAGTDQTWHRIDSITSATSLEVTPKFVAADAGRAYEFLKFDRTWVDISAVNGGGPPDTLTLASPGTEVDTGVNNYDYVIRRPMDATYATIRYIGSGFVETTIAFF